MTDDLFFYIFLFFHNFFILLINLQFLFSILLKKKNFLFINTYEIRVQMIQRIKYSINGISACS